MTKRRGRCKVCGVSRSPGTPISKRGRCPRCAEEAFQQSQEEIKAGRGPTGEAWREGLLRAVERSREAP